MEREGWGIRHKWDTSEMQTFSRKILKEIQAALKSESFDNALGAMNILQKHFLSGRSHYFHLLKAAYQASRTFYCLQYVSGLNVLYSGF
jgi:hypothetical protein